MATWRCPHCGTPQAESSRCWACSRSPMTCRTCLFFRRAVAGRLGFCALDRRREALDGEEMRPCWQAPARSYGPLPGLFADLDAPVVPHASIHAEASPARLDPSLVPPPRQTGGVSSAPERPPQAASAIPVRPEPRPVPMGSAPAEPPAAGPVPVGIEPEPPRLPASLLTRRARPAPRETSPEISLAAAGDRSGGLVEAPLVMPSRRLVSLADRMAWTERRSPAAAPSDLQDPLPPGETAASSGPDGPGVDRGGDESPAAADFEAVGEPALEAARGASPKGDAPGPAGPGAVG